MSDYECPYCKTEYQDDLEWASEGRTRTEFDCDECGKTFHLEVEFDPVYSVSCIESEHDYQPNPNIKFTGWLFCVHCGKAKQKEVEAP